jgi:DNA polymerase alpha-associated DNA helicase A
MNSKIIEFSSKFMYDDKLKSHESCADIKLHGLRSIQQNETTEESLVWYDTQGGLFHDRADDLENNEIIQSKYNDNEATLVVSHVEKLLDSDCTFDDIGVISPYRAQVALLKRELRCRFESRKNYKQIEVSTVDGFQGREKEVIIISLVRSNDEHEVGFLKDKRRLNVAITRAKRQLVIIGDMETLDGSKNKYLKDLVSYMEEEADLIYP